MNLTELNPIDFADYIGSYTPRIEEIVRPAGMDDQGFDKHIRTFFHRVNVTSGGMSEQEIRNNHFAGDLTDLLFSLHAWLGFKSPDAKSVRMDPKESGDGYFFFSSKICTSTDILRMEDMELILSLLHAISMKDGMAHKTTELGDFYRNNENMNKDNPNLAKNLETAFKQNINILKAIEATGAFTFSTSRFRKKNDFYSLFCAVDRLRRQGFTTDNSNILAVAKSLTRFGELVNMIESDVDESEISAFGVSAEWCKKANNYYENIHQNWSFKENREIRRDICEEILGRQRAI
jgi:hypothetical protein